jgi:putative intracellular protease/amidase
LSKKALFILTSRSHYDDGSQTGLWLEEASVPYEVLNEAGIDVDLVSIEGGSVPIDDNSTQNDELNKYSSFVEKIKDVSSIEDIKVEDYDAVYLPGGHGTVFDFGHNQALASLIADFKDQNKFISSVCHGPSAFVGAKDNRGNFLVNGVTLTSFTDDEERAMGLEEKVPFLTQTELEKQGAKFITKDNFVSHVEEDGLFITGQNPQSSEAVGKALRDALQK